MMFYGDDIVPHQWSIFTLDDIGHVCERDSHLVGSITEAGLEPLGSDGLSQVLMWKGDESWPN